MKQITYRIVEHENGWAYQQGTSFSETFGTHDEARAAAVQACRVQKVPGETLLIEFQDPSGLWITECAPGDDRPEISIQG